MRTKLRSALGAKVRRLRKERGYTQEYLTELADLSQAYLSRVECGVANPQLDKLEKIATALGITLSELFKIDTSGAPTQEMDQREKARRIGAIFQALPVDMAAKLYDCLAVQVKRK